MWIFRLSVASSSLQLPSGLRMRVIRVIRALLDKYTLHFYVLDLALRLLALPVSLLGFKHSLDFASPSSKPFFVADKKRYAVRSRKLRSHRTHLMIQTGAVQWPDCTNLAGWRIIGVLCVFWWVCLLLGSAQR